MTRAPRVAASPSQQLSPLRRRALFFSLYLSEGAPIGYIWLALPTRLRSAGVAIDEIATLTALVVVPWTLKFVWAPALDLLRGPRWGLQSWILSAQTLMGVTLLATTSLSIPGDLELLLGLLVMHAIAAATQDVGIDALCIATTTPDERGRLNGWMQAGMLLGRASMGGGALVLAGFIGWDRVVWVLVAITLFSMVLLRRSGLDSKGSHPHARARRREIWRAMASALREARTWFALVFAAVGGAGFKSLEVLLGPFLVDRGYTETEVGAFTALPMIGAMVIGSLLGGVLADRGSRSGVVAWCLGALTASIAALAAADLAAGGQRGMHLWIGLVAIAVCIGAYTATSYALFMDVTRPAIAAVQFSAFMGATNGCEAWSTFVAGEIVAASGYPAAMLGLSALSLLALPALRQMAPPGLEEGGQQRA